jgi:hypothetical protein
MQRQVDELKAELARMRKRKREAEDGVKVKQEDVDMVGLEPALSERGRARKRARVAESTAGEAER